MAGIQSSRFLSLCAFVALCLPSPVHAQGDVAAKVHSIKTDHKVEVTLKSGEILKGRMGASSNERFTLEPMKAKGVRRAIAYNQVKSIRATGLSKRDKWIIFAVIWVGVGIVAGATI